MIPDCCFVAGVFEYSNILDEMGLTSCSLILKMCIMLKIYWDVCWEQCWKCKAENRIMNETMVRFRDQKAGLVNLLLLEVRHSPYIRNLQYLRVRQCWGIED